MTLYNIYLNNLQTVRVQSPKKTNQMFQGTDFIFLRFIRYGKFFTVIVSKVMDLLNLSNQSFHKSLSLV